MTIQKIAIAGSSGRMGRTLLEAVTQAGDLCVAAALEMDGGSIREARLGLGGVAHKPWRDPAAEAGLRGRPPGNAAFQEAADTVLRDAKGYAHNAFKIDLARRTIVRALTQAANGTPQVQSSKKIA